MIAAGKSILDKECQRLGIKTPNLNDMLSHFKQIDSDSLLEAIGRGDISNRQLAACLKIPELEDQPIRAKLKKSLAKSVVTVAGIDNVHTVFAHCCEPVLGDDIIGYISQHKGITVHRSDCKNVVQLSPEKQNQLINVTWGAEKASHAVPIIIRAFNAQNVLGDVSKVLTQAKIHIFDAALATHSDFSAPLTLTIQIENTHQLSIILNKISQLSSIMEVKRKT
jgi:GTP pyrophosphokinase